MNHTLAAVMLAALALPASADEATRTPIKHLVIIIGENRSFDHVFATYEPRGGERVWNLLSQDIVRVDGTPGKNFRIAEQRAATDSPADAFLLNPPKKSFAGGVLPAPLAGARRNRTSRAAGWISPSKPRTACRRNIIRRW